MRFIEKHKKLMSNLPSILQQERQGVSIKDIAKEFEVERTIIYLLLRNNGVHRERRPKVNIGKKLIEPLSFKERISQEMLAKIKYNTVANKGKVKYYEWPEDWIPKKRVLEGG